jgi:hypothetical protein
MDGNENDKQPKFTQIKRWETFMLFYISQVASAIIPHG